MADFAYYAPGSLRQALQILAQRGQETRILAGGTDLLVQMKSELIRPEVIVDIGGLDELRGIRVEQEFLWMGPLTTHRELYQSPLVRAHGLALARGAGQVGSPQIRHRGTIAGNLANASPAADTVPPLVVLEAQVEMTSLERSRWVLAESFTRGPGETILGPGELITGLRIPLRTTATFDSGYEKFGARNALSIAVAGVAVAAEKGPDGRMSQARIALGSVGPTVLRASQAEDLLRDRILDERLITQAAAAAGEQCCPIDDVRSSAWYRRQLVSVLLARILRFWKGQ